jgi:hypothetical protein
MKIRKGQKLVLIGDSITDAGRAQPVGEGLGDPLGRGFVTQVESLLGVTYPERGIRVVNVGTSGSTSIQPRLFLSSSSNPPPPLTSSSSTSPPFPRHLI